MSDNIDVTPSDEHEVLQEKESGFKVEGDTMLDLNGGSGSIAWTATGPENGFAERRTGSFANDGTPKVHNRGTNLQTAGNGSIYVWGGIGSTQTEVMESPAKPEPRGMVWDGSNFWQTSNESYIYKLDENLNIVGGFTAPNDSAGPTFDGSNLFMHPHNVGYIYEYDRNGNEVSSIETPTDQVRDVAWDGDALVFPETRSSTNFIYRMDRSGTVINSFPSPGSNPFGMEWVGDRYLHTDRAANYIYELDRGLNVIGGTNAPHGEAGHLGICWDGGRVFVSAHKSRHLYRYDQKYSYIGGVIE